MSATKRKVLKRVRVSKRCSVTITRNQYVPGGAGMELIVSSKGGPFRAKDSYAFTMTRARSIAARRVRWLRNTGAC